MRIAIVGGGLTGLTAAYQLSLDKHQVVVFEKEKTLGGLATGFSQEKWDWSLDNFFHHLFTDDKAAQKLIEQLGLSDKLFYTQAKTSIFKNGQIYQFDSPLSVLKFPLLSIPDRLRTGAITFWLKTLTNWQSLEKITAENWLKKAYGVKVYQTLWQPLLKAKFVDQVSQINMAWFWARVKKRSFQLGYLEGGFQVLVDQLAKQIKKNRGQIFLDHPVSQFSELEKEFDRVIFTVPVSVFLEIMGQKLPKTDRQKMTPFEMVGALNLVLALKKSLLTDGTYWLNVNQSGFPFVAVVEHTNFVDPKNYNDQHLVYLGGYYPQNHKYFKADKKEILAEFIPHLKKINPGFSRSSIVNSHLSTNLFAQPIVPVNYSKMIPPLKTSVPGVFLVNMQNVYPWDRGINYAVDFAQKVVHEITKN